MRQKIEALQVTVQAMLSSVGTAPNSHPVMVVPVCVTKPTQAKQRRTGESKRQSRKGQNIKLSETIPRTGVGPQRLGFLPRSFQPRPRLLHLLEAAGLPLDLQQSARRQCKQYLSKLAKVSDSMEREAEWSDLVSALKADT